MGSNDLQVWAGSQRLQALANHFRPYKPPQLTVFTKRAAVLVCLFRDDSGGDLRVILTKRSSDLSTHSGKHRFRPRLIVVPCDNVNRIVSDFSMQGKLLFQVGKLRKVMLMTWRLPCGKLRRRLAWTLLLSMLLQFLNPL